jgi:hypothetical protein
MGCATVGPRFDPNIAAGFAQEPMRKLETRHVELYYPTSERDAAERIASRLEACAISLREKVQRQSEPPRMLVYLTHANFNNAYVQAEYAGLPLQMVLPIHSTLETDNFLLFGSVNQGNIACHEAAHYVQNEQTHGFWSWVNTVGGAVATPSQGLERWFTEGLAVWTEGHSGLRTGRPWSPFWYGVFEAAIAERGYRLRSGDLSPATRDLYGSGAYLTSSFFVDYLIRTYGENKLWELIDLQGGSIISTFGVNLRFRAIYGRTLDQLFAEFSEHLTERLPRRERPRSEQLLAPVVGSFARFALSPTDGARVIIANGYDVPVRLTVYERDGTERFHRAMTEVVPLRHWIGVGATSVSGLRFSPDGRLIYAVFAVLDTAGNDATELWALDAKSGRPLRKWPLFGIGGDISPDGRKYIYVGIHSDRANLVELDLESGKQTVLTDFEPLRSLGAPAYSPDGQRVVFSMWNGESFDLALRDASGAITMLTRDGLANYAPRWLDDHSLLFLRQHEKRWQVFRLDLESKSITPVSDTPHLALDPMPTGDGRVAFLTRDGVNFSLFSAPIPTAEWPAETAASTTVPPLPAAAAPPVEVLRDRPYSSLDHLFIPYLHAPFVQLRQDPVEKWILTGGLSFSGSDRLGYHNYGADLWIDSATTKFSFTFDYGWHRLAPWWFQLHLERSFISNVGVEYEFRDASLIVSRRFWDLPLSLMFGGHEQQNDVTGRTLLVGPDLSANYTAVETTPYGGVRRALRFGATVGAYPGALGSSVEQEATAGVPGIVVPRSVDIVNLRGMAGFTVPLPFSRRHSLGIDLVGRAMLGTDTDILRVGGVGAGYTIAGACTNGCIMGGGRALPGGVVFTEPLRGYEDFVFRTTRVAIGNARYRYPIIFDRGAPSVAWALPSFWVSQLNIDLFGTWAFIEPRTLARAAGASVSLFTLWGQAVPISISYQFAYRFDAGLSPLHLIGFSY